MTSITKKYLINGPNNVIRLTDGVKVLYIFGDYHLELHNQTECIYNDKYDSMDIDKFLLSFMRNNKNIKYDIFHEINDFLYNEYNNNTNYYYKKRYIDNINKLFQNNIKNKYTNFKFHYMDFRQNLFLYNILKNYNNDYIYNNHYTDKQIIFLFNDYIKLFKLFIKSLNKNKYIQKILNKYNNPNIKKKINEIYNLLIKNYKLILQNINNLIKFIKLNYNNKIINTYYENIDPQIEIYLNTIFELFFQICIVLTDLYFIRRFLDKKYINNGILYTGHAHMSNISYLLVKYFNYKITHINYLPKNIDINDYIIKLSNKNVYIFPLSDLLTKKINNDKIYQCTDLFNFPNNFT